MVARERRLALGGFTDAGEFAQDEDHARDQSGVLIELVVGVGWDLVWSEVAGSDERDERLKDDLGPLVLCKRAPSLRDKRHGLPEATDPCAHGMVVWLLIAGQEEGPIIDVTISLQSLQAAVDVADESVVADHHGTKDSIDLHLVLEDRFVVAPQLGHPRARQ